MKLRPHFRSGRHGGAAPRRRLRGGASAPRTRPVETRRPETPEARALPAIQQRKAVVPRSRPPAHPAGGLADHLAEACFGISTPRPARPLARVIRTRSSPLTRTSRLHAPSKDKVQSYTAVPANVYKATNRSRSLSIATFHRFRNTLARSGTSSSSRVVAAIRSVRKYRKSSRSSHQAARIRPWSRYPRSTGQTFRVETEPCSSEYFSSSLREPVSPLGYRRRECSQLTKQRALRLWLADQQGVRAVRAGRPAPSPEGSSLPLRSRARPGS